MRILIDKEFYLIVYEYKLMILMFLKFLLNKCHFIDTDWNLFK